LIRTTKAKIGKPLAIAKAIGLFLGRTIEGLERIVSGRNHADLEKALAETKALRAGLAKIAGRKIPVPALVPVEAPLRSLAEKVGSFIVQQSNHLFGLAATASDEQLRRFALAVRRYSRRARAIDATFSPGRGSHAAIASQIGALDAMIASLGSFVEARIGSI
jgi:hypothetical protein